jgi:hypothetical protein
VKNAVDALDRGLAKSTVNRTLRVYRGTMNDVFDGDPHELVGRVIADPAYLSTSVNRPFSGQVEWRITVPKGHQGAALEEMTGVAEWRETREGEILFARNTRLRIDAVKPSDISGQDWVVEATML